MFVYIVLATVVPFMLAYLVMSVLDRKKTPKSTKPGKNSPAPKKLA